MVNPFISIIIPVFNREKLITETLDSVINQSYPFWEAIVVDDGSSDNSIQVIKSYEARDKRIRLLLRDREPKNASVCRNIGIENAKGKYLIFLDSDDLLTPNCLETRVDYMETHSTLDFAVFQMELFDHNGIIKNSKIVQKKENYLYAYLKHDLPWAITCPIWKTEFVREQLKGFNKAYPRLQDPEFNTRALMTGNVRFEVLVDSETDCFYRSHTDKSLNIKILMKGYSLYLEEFSKRILQRDDYTVCKRQLKGCYKWAVWSFYSYYSQRNDIDGTLHLYQLQKVAIKNKLISYLSFGLTSLLRMLYSLNVETLPGGKYVLRTVMKLIKIF